MPNAPFHGTSQDEKQAWLLLATTARSKVMEAPTVPSDNRILYYGRDRAAFRFLSHFHPSPFALDGQTWPTVEHYYQWHKSFDLDYRATIRATERPGHVKRLAAAPDAPRRFSQHSWFKKHQTIPRPDWNEAKLDIMRRADRAKYTQNADLAALLLMTKTAELVEDASSEPFWGIGSDGRGLNWAGRVLMEVREELRSANASDDRSNELTRRLR